MSEGCNEHPGVLIVDDEPIIADLVRRCFQSAGYPAWSAIGGKEAVTVVRENPGRVGVLLLDVQMPELDGPATLAAIRELLPSVRCYFMSGDLGRYSEQDLFDLGARGLFLKPFRCQDLLTVFDLRERSRPPQVET
ncbi:MAG: response regulator [Gemmataceae bacterium]